MALREQFEAQGAFLFRWRSYLPIAMLPLLVLAGQEAGAIQLRLGEHLATLWESGAMLLGFAGLAVRIVTVGFVSRDTSGRNTHEQRAAMLNTTGVYSIVRNPLYVGNFLVFFSFLLFTKVAWLCGFGALVYILYYERIVFAEEAFLRGKFGQQYLDWAARTPAMLPNFALWRAPAQSFSGRSVLRREYNGFYLLVVCFCCLHGYVQAMAAPGGLGGIAVEDLFGRDWQIFFCVGTVIFVTLRILKKHTLILQVAGR